MTTQNISQLQSYVQSLELATPDTFIQDINLSGFLSLADEDKEAGYVNAGSIVSFVSGVSKEHQQDVLNSGQSALTVSSIFMKRPSPNR